MAGMVQCGGSQGGKERGFGRERAAVRAVEEKEVSAVIEDIALAQNPAGSQILSPLEAEGIGQETISHRLCKAGGNTIGSTATLYGIRWAVLGEGVIFDA